MNELIDERLVEEAIDAYADHFVRRAPRVRES